MKIEETLSMEALPVNTIAMANRLIEILKEEKTNSALDLRNANMEQEFLFLNNNKGAAKFRKCLWLINQQVFGQLGKIDLEKEWQILFAIDTE